MNKKQTDFEKIFSELQTLIPELKDADPNDWRQFFIEFMENRPDSTINTQFKKDLKNTILQHLDTMEHKQTTNSWPQWAKLSFTFAGGVALAALVITPILNPQNIETQPQNKIQTAKLQSKKSADFLSPITISQNETKNAFGTIETESASSEGAEMSDQAVAGISEKRISEDALSIMPYPPYGGRTNYEYEYIGKDIVDLSTETKVYKKQVTKKSAENLLSALKGFETHLLNLENFKDLTLQNLSVKELTGEYPYFINLDFQNQSVNISQDYEVWNRTLCAPNPYCDYKQLKKEDVLADKELKKIAENFLKKHDINLANTSTPYIEKYWEREDAFRNDIEEPTYYPEVLAVIYPLSIENQSINQSWGGKLGIRVDINMRHKKVTNVHIPLLNLESSIYDSHSTEEILKLAQSGGDQGVTYNNPEKTVTLKLETPTKELRQIWYTNKDNKRQELFVEMLVFPIQKTEDKNRYHWQKEILVPIAKDIYKK